MLTMQVSRWSRAAASLLPPQQAVIGRVHSCYARIINVRTPGGRLLTLQGEGMLQAPLGLALATDVETLGTRLPVGALVVQDIPTARRSPAALRLRCADALAWDGQVLAQPGLTPSVLACRAHELTAWLCLHTPARGLTPLLLALNQPTWDRHIGFPPPSQGEGQDGGEEPGRLPPALAPHPTRSPRLRRRRGASLTAPLPPRRGEAVEPNAPEPMGLSATNAAAYTALAPLWAGRQAFAVPTLLTLVQALVGLGEGLTPSGDDFLVGLLAVLHATGFLPCGAGSPVHAQFCQCVRLGTSQLSGEFVRCAFEGYFAEPLAMLVRALCALATAAWPVHAATLAAVGHSSGVDAMVGIALGCRLLA